MKNGLFVFLAAILFPIVSHQETFEERVAASQHLDLPVIEVVSEYAPYNAFCERNTTECDMSGPSVMKFDTSVQRLLDMVNKSVNREITFTLNQDQHGIEEYWSYPVNRRGDCEDIALEKRARLVRNGLPRSTLRLAIVFHRAYLSSHCILTAETTAGTYVLDSFSDTISLWHDAPYYFESRERNDGRWDKFDQSTWYSGFP